MRRGRWGNALRTVMPIFLAVLLLSVAELALEYRAAKRGFSTLVFSGGGERKQTADKSIGDAAMVAFGPGPSFPFRSRIPNGDEQGSVWICSASHAADPRLEIGKIFPTILDQKLASLIDPERVVVNASRAGASIEQNLEMLEEYGLLAQPEVCVLYQAANEFSFLANRSVESPANTPIAKPFLANVRAEISKFGESTTMYGRLLRNNVTPWLTKACPKKSSLGEDANSHYRSRLLKFIKYVEDSGATPFVCTFALRTPTKVIPPAEELFYLKTTPTMQPSSWQKQVREWNELIRNEIPEDQVIDVAAYCETHPEWFRDPVHFSEDGHQAVADYLSSELFARFFSKQ